MLSGIEQLTLAARPAVLIFSKKYHQKVPASTRFPQLRLLHSGPEKQQHPPLGAAGFGHFSRLFGSFIPFIGLFTPSRFQIGNPRYIFVSLPPAGKQPDHLKGPTHKNSEKSEKFRVGTAVVIK
jgi:hypothetical protein